MTKGKLSIQIRLSHEGQDHSSRPTPISHAQLVDGVRNTSAALVQQRFSLLWH